MMPKTGRRTIQREITASCPGYGQITPGQEVAGAVQGRRLTFRAHQPGVSAPAG